MPHRWLNLFFVLGVSSVAGCYSDPFTRGPLPELRDVNANSLPAHVAFRTPPRFSSQDTIILQFPFHDDVSGIAVIDVDRPAGTMELVGLTANGLELFHLAVDRSGPIVRSAIPPLMKHKEILLALARDLGMAFLDLAPANGAIVHVDATQVEYVDADGVSRALGGSPVVLLDKHQSGGFGDAWRVRYFDYVVGDEGFSHPKNIVIDDGHYRTRIILTNQDWSLDAK